MLEDLQWPSLQHQWYVTRVKLFYNIINSSSVLSIPITLRTPLIPLATTTLSILKFLLLEQIIINAAISPNLFVTGAIYLLTLLNPNLYNYFHINYNWLFCAICNFFHCLTYQFVTVFSVTIIIIIIIIIHCTMVSPFILHCFPFSFAGEQQDEKLLQRCR